MIPNQPGFLLPPFLLNFIISVQKRYLNYHKTYFVIILIDDEITKHYSAGPMPRPSLLDPLQATDRSVELFGGRPSRGSYGLDLRWM